MTFNNCPSDGDSFLGVLLHLLSWFFPLFLDFFDSLNRLIIHFTELLLSEFFLNKSYNFMSIKAVVLKLVRALWGIARGSIIFLLLKWWKSQPTLWKLLYLGIQALTANSDLMCVLLVQERKAVWLQKRIIFLKNVNNFLEINPYSGVFLVTKHLFFWLQNNWEPLY